jgi:hypothetical protein
LSRLRARDVAPAVARGAIAPSRGVSRRERTRSRVTPRAAIGGDGHGSAKKSAARSPMPPDPSRGADRPSSIATEEDAEVDAASRASRLKALVARKRLYFAVLEAEETTERPVPEKTTALAKIVVDAAAPESASALADAADAGRGRRRGDYRTWKNRSRGWTDKERRCSRRPKKKEGTSSV